MLDRIGHRRGTNWLVIAFTASLALNLVFAGFFVARMLPTDETPVVRSASERAFARIERLLPEDDALILRGIFNDHAVQFQDLQDEFLEALGAVSAALDNDQFDSGQLAAAMAEARAKRSSFGDLVIQTFVEAMAGVSPEGRRMVAASLTGTPLPPR